MTETKIEDFYKKQIILEKEIIKAAEEAVSDVKNNLVKELILSISLDSKKHIGLLNALLSLEESVQPFISEEKLNLIANNIQTHIQLEQKAINTYKELLNKIDKEQAKAIIQAIYNDELRHHALLKKLHKKIIEVEAITQDDIWDSIKEDFIPQF